MNKLIIVVLIFIEQSILIFSQTYPLEWESVPVNAWGGIAEFAITDNYIFVATNNKGIYRSPLSSFNYTEVFNDPKLKTINFFKFSGSRLYLHHLNYTQFEQQFAYYSTNFGSSWIKKTISIASYIFQPTNLTIHQNDLFFSSTTGYGVSDESISIVSNKVVKEIDIDKSYLINDLKISSNDSIYAISYGNGFFSTLYNSDTWARPKKEVDSKLYTVIYIDDTDIYLGTEDKGLYKYSTKTGEYKSLSYNLTGANITGIAVFYGRLYITSSNYGVHYLDAKQNKWIEVNKNITNPKISKLIAYKNTLYVLTQDDRIYKAIIPEPIPVITLRTLGESNVCALKSIKIFFDVTDYFFKPDNVFQVYLSDSSGNFNNYKIIGSKKGQFSDSILITFPDSLPLSKFYRIKVVASNPQIESQPSKEYFTITPLPNPLITGELDVCSKREYTYKSIKNPKNSILWEISNGAFKSKSNDSVVVVWDDASNGKLTVYEATPNYCRNSFSISINISETPPKPNITKIQDTLFVDAEDGIQWYYNGQILTGAKQQKLIIAADGYYKVIIDTYNGCPSDFSDEIYAERSKPNDVNIYYANNLIILPNPASDYIELSILNCYYNINIYNSLGECIMQIGDKALSSTHRIDISQLPQGIYFLKIGTSIEKFVKY